MEQEAREKERKRQSESSNNLLTGEPISQEQSMSLLLSSLPAHCMSLIIFSSFILATFK